MKDRGARRREMTGSIQRDRAICPVCRALMFLIATVLLAGQAEDLARFADAHEYFDYRDTVLSMAKPPELARGVVACMFNDPRQCERHTRRVIQSAASNDEKETAHLFRLAFYLAHGRSRSASAEWGAMVKLGSRPDPGSI